MIPKFFTQSLTTENPATVIDKLSRLAVEEFHHGYREHHTQKSFIPVATAKLNRTVTGRKPKKIHAAADVISSRSPSTYRLNKSNVKHKPSSRRRF